jgi:hypothetical protein
VGALVLLVCVLLVCAPLAALEVPAGTAIEVRLKTKLSAAATKAGDAVEAIVIAPVMVGGEFAIPAGAPIRGSVTKSAASTQGDERSTLLLGFAELEVAGAKLKCAARVSGVDNARESVDEQGQINGILASETISGRIDAGLAKLEEKSARFAGFLETVKKAVMKAPESDIAYDPGVEMTLVLTAPLTLTSALGPGPAADLQPVDDESALEELVNRLPFQTVAQKPPRPSDITNVMLIGSADAVEAAFKDAGWSNAAALSLQAKVRTFQAIAEDRGYKEAPVSILMLEGRPPDWAFEKLNNTFAQRHHLRVWKRSETLDGQPVWLIAATHDTGIAFSERDRTFIHKIDSEIDRERAKVVNDLLLTGRARSVELVDRPAVPAAGENATGDSVKTDARMAVLVLK